MMSAFAVFGAGIAGLTAAHEFAKRGYSVKVFESNLEAGGFFRSARRKEDNNIPSEYSWHGMGPWVGSDWCNVSFHQVAKFFKAQLTSKPAQK